MQGNTKWQFQSGILQGTQEMQYNTNSHFYLFFNFFPSSFEAGRIIAL